jgi:hypothetical protein
VVLGVLILGIVVVQAVMILRGRWGSPVDVGGTYAEGFDGSVGDGGACN